MWNSHKTRKKSKECERREEWDSQKKEGFGCGKMIVYEKRENVDNAFIEQSSLTRVLEKTLQFLEFEMLWKEKRGKRTYCLLPYSLGTHIQQCCAKNSEIFMKMEQTVVKHSMENVIGGTIAQPKTLRCSSAWEKI